MSSVHTSSSEEDISSSGFFSSGLPVTIIIDMSELLDVDDNEKSETAPSELFDPFELLLLGFCSSFWGCLVPKPVVE